MYIRKNKIPVMDSSGGNADAPPAPRTNVYQALTLNLTGPTHIGICNIIILLLRLRRTFLFYHSSFRHHHSLSPRKSNITDSPRATDCTNTPIQQLSLNGQIVQASKRLQKSPQAKTLPSRLRQTRRTLEKERLQRRTEILRHIAQL